MTAESIGARALRNEKILKLLEGGLSAAMLGERFGMRQNQIFEVLRCARERREKMSTEAAE